MEGLWWLLCNRTAETLLIFNLFHLLLAGLTLLVLAHQLRETGEAAGISDRLLTLGFLVFVLYFTLHTIYFGAAFFFRKGLDLTALEHLCHGLFTSGLLLVVAGLHARRNERSHGWQWMLLGCAGVMGIVLVGWFTSSQPTNPAEHLHSPAMLFTDAVALAVALFGIRVVLKAGQESRWAHLVALASVSAALALHGAFLVLPQRMAVFAWNSEEHFLSAAFFAFTWGTGERSHKLLDRVFVRLNLTFIVLASLIMLITAGMEKYQYFRLAEDRSMDLAEFLRGHVIYYRARGEGLKDIFQHPEVLKRVIVEFGTLPELRQVNVYLNRQRATFRYTDDWEVKEEIVPLAGQSRIEAGVELADRFQMIRMPIETGTDSDGRIEFFGTTDFINRYIGKYIIFIYTLFTIMVALSTVIIGIIVADADRRLRQHYAELEGTHQQLAQAAKLASVGQLAGGIAHEINNPITSILSLATHLAEKNEAVPHQRRSLQLIAQQAQRVSRIVGNLLTLARQSHMAVSRVDLGESLDMATELVEFRLRDSGIHLRREIDPNLPPILADADRLTEVFVNLLNNAIDAMPEGGMLTLRAFSNSPEGGVRVEVTDTGRGIPPDQLPRIFDPFFTTKEPGRGTGLGLSISHGIVKDHGGQICADSHQGAGTTLRVTLPRGRMSG